MVAKGTLCRPDRGVSMSRLAYLRGESDEPLIVTPSRAALAAEIVVGAVLLGLTAVLVGPHLTDLGPSKRAETARHQIETFASGLDLYNLDIGHYPTTTDGLEALVQAPAGNKRWAGPYTRQTTIPKDPWGDDYVYGSSGGAVSYTLVSRGLEGERP